MNSKLRDILEKLYDNATVAHKTIGINNAKSVDVPGAEQAILALFESYASNRGKLARKKERQEVIDQIISEGKSTFTKKEALGDTRIVNIETIKVTIAEPDLITLKELDGRQE